MNLYLPLPDQKKTQPTAADVDAAVFLSVVIPVYNEQTRIGDTLFAVKDFLDCKDYDSEIIVVDDGSLDTTLEVIRVIDIYQQEFKQQSPCRIAVNNQNTGKGFSVARGCRIAVGQFVLFMDADSSTDISEVDKLLSQMEQPNNKETAPDVVIGTRRNKGLSQRPLHRRLLSTGFRLCLKLAGIREYQDTQCGFKLYRQHAIKKIIARQTVSRWCFDVEHLFIAEKLGLSITSVPVIWRHTPGSKLSPISDSVKMLIELIRIRLRHRNLKKRTPTQTRTSSVRLLEK